MSLPGPLPFDTYVKLVGPLIDGTAAALEQVDAKTAVPGCPDWTAGDLRDHCAGVLAFWIQQLRVADAEATGPNFDGGVRERHRLPLGELGPELLAELEASSPDGQCWNWSGADFTAAWAARRMTQEFAVHHCDARATAGLPVSIDTDLAADGVDELVEVFVGNGDGQPAAEVGVLELSSSDSRRWLLSIGPDGATQADEAAAPTASVRGPVDQILLHLWDRPATAVEESGDPAVMATWRLLARFD